MNFSLRHLRVLRARVRGQLLPRALWKHLSLLICVQPLPSGKNLLTAIHTRRLVDVVREAEIAGLFILNNRSRLKRVVRSAIIDLSLLYDAFELT